MNKIIAMVSVLMTMAGMAQAAPYFSGPGCNEDGTSCLFGTPSGRVESWAKKGSVEEMGGRCEKFINNIEARKNRIAKSREIDLKYKDFTAFWSQEQDENGNPKINCRVELHSELPKVFFQRKLVKRYFWVCKDKSQDGLCAHSLSECEAIRDQALNDKDVLDATIYFDATILQGNICEVVTIKFK